MADLLLARVAKLRDNPVGADITIVCSDQEFKADSLVVCAHSEVLAKVLAEHDVSGTTRVSDKQG
jgi:hypothetical protein